MHTKMILAFLFAAALLVAMALPLSGGAGQAFADPVRNPNAVVFTVDCGDGSFDVVATPGAASQALASTVVGVAMTTEARVFVNGVLVFEESVVRGRGVDNLLTCSFFAEFVDPETGATIRIEGEGQVLGAPRGG